MTRYKLKKTLHFVKYHEKFIPWSLVVETIYFGKRKSKGKNIIEFTSRSGGVYVLCRYDEKNKTFNVINAKKVKK